MLFTFDLPDPGEGLTEAEVVQWRVAVGDQILINQPVVEIETAKSLVELPSPFAGTVTRLLVEEGTEVPVGTPLLEIDTAPDGQDEPGPGTAQAGTEPAAAAASTAPADSVPTAPGAAADPAVDRGVAADPEIPTPDAPAPAPDGGPEAPAPATGSGGQDAPERTPTLVGYGVRTTAPVRRRRRGRPTPDTGPDRQVPIDRILAKPPVRKLAKDLGIALADVLATGRDGIVTREDVLAAVDRPEGARAAVPRSDDAHYFPDEAPQVPEGLSDTMKSTRHQPFPGVTSDERTTRVPIRSVRKRTAEAMVSSAFTAPHVTVFNTVDMTASMELVSRLKADREWRDIRVSPLLIVAKALLVAIRRNPEVNASWDEGTQEIVYKHYVNLGIAAATPRGLIVPNVKDAHLKTLRELAADISDLTATARAGRTPVSATRDGTITVTNFGVFGIDSGTPILNPGESVILGMGAVEQKPWVHDGEIVPRPVTTLALSFDHRLIDGALGSVLMRDVSAVLEHPEMGLVWG